MLSKAGEIRRDEACLDYSGNEVVLYPCHGSKGNQVFIFFINFFPIIFEESYLFLFLFHL